MYSERATPIDERDLTNPVGPERARVVSYLVKLNRCIAANHVDLVLALTRRFTEALVDYVSYSHFRLLREFNPSTDQIAALSNLTDQVMNFNDRYADRGWVSLPQLKTDLEAVALALEVRFEIEDDLLLPACA